MICIDEAALICDFAETYQIYDWRSLPATYAATLAAGLRESSRIMMRLAGAKLTTEQSLLACIADHVRLLVWQNTADGHAGANAPKSILHMLTEQSSSDEESVGFDSTSDFKAWRETMIGGGKNA